MQRKSSENGSHGAIHPNKEVRDEEIPALRRSHRCPHRNLLAGPERYGSCRGNLRVDARETLPVPRHGVPVRLRRRHFRRPVHLLPRLGLPGLRSSGSGSEGRRHDRGVPNPSEQIPPSPFHIPWGSRRRDAPNPQRRTVQSPSPVRHRSALRRAIPAGRLFAGQAAANSNTGLKIIKIEGPSARAHPSGCCQRRRYALRRDVPPSPWPPEGVVNGLGRLYTDPRLSAGSVRAPPPDSQGPTARITSSCRGGPVWVNRQSPAAVGVGSRCEQGASGGAKAEGIGLTRTRCER